MSVYGWMASLSVGALLLIGGLTLIYALIYMWQSDDKLAVLGLTALLVIGAVGIIGVVGLYAEAGR